MKARGLKALAPLRQQLAQGRQRAQEEAREQAAAERHARAERDLFVRAAGPVQALRTPIRHAPVIEPPAPLPRQRLLDQDAVLRESLSDGFDPGTLLETDDGLSFRRPSIGPEVPTRLRRGHWSVQGQIDLHGLRVDEAREALAAFLRQARRTGLRCVRVVHGKGLGSPGRVPVLKARVQAWLAQKDEVLAFVQAPGHDGGAGALLVLLAASRPPG